MTYKKRKIKKKMKTKKLKQFRKTKKHYKKINKKLRKTLNKKGGTNQEICEEIWDGIIGNPQSYPCKRFAYKDDKNKKWYMMRRQANNDCGERGVYNFRKICPDDKNKKLNEKMNKIIEEEQKNALKRSKERIDHAPTPGHIAKQDNMSTREDTMPDFLREYSDKGESGRFSRSSSSSSNDLGEPMRSSKEQRRKNLGF